MPTVIQRVSKAAVVVDGREVGTVGRGLLVLAGIEQGDTEKDLVWTAEKVVNLRVFEDAQGKMNLAVGEVSGGILLVPTSPVAATRKRAGAPALIPRWHRRWRNRCTHRLVEAITLAAAGAGVQIPVATGVFRSMMEVSLANDGPVTIVISSRGPM